MPVAFSNGDGSWQITHQSIGDFAGWAATSGAKPLIGDFNGDVRSDIALLRRIRGHLTKRKDCTLRPVEGNFGANPLAATTGADLIEQFRAQRVASSVVPYRAYIGPLYASKSGEFGLDRARRKPPRCARVLQPLERAQPFPADCALS